MPSRTTSQQWLPGGWNEPASSSPNALDFEWEGVLGCASGLHQQRAVESIGDDRIHSIRSQVHRGRHDPTEIQSPKMSRATCTGACLLVRAHGPCACVPMCSTCMIQEAHEKVSANDDPPSQLIVAGFVTSVVLNRVENAAQKSDTFHVAPHRFKQHRADGRVKTLAQCSTHEHAVCVCQVAAFPAEPSLYGTCRAHVQTTRCCSGPTRTSRRLFDASRERHGDSAA